jgi:large subunit ribosomal protein L4
MEKTLSVNLYSSEGKQIDTLNVDMDIFGQPLHKAAMYQEIQGHRANQRSGLASTKTMGEVSGGGKKPWKQKGTGRARVGSIRSPLWRHGGVIFGPHPRDFSYTVPKKIKSLALRSALSQKVLENNLVVIEQVPAGKTKQAATMIQGIDALIKKTRKANYMLLLLDTADAAVVRSVRNIRNLSVGLAKDTNAYEVLTHRRIVITKEGLNQLTKRLQK